MEPCCHTRRCATITSQHGTSGLLERAAITHCAGCAANDRPIVVSAEMHAISQRGLEGGDARLGHIPGRPRFCAVLRVGGGASSVFGQVQLAAGGANFRQVQAGDRVP